MSEMSCARTSCSSRAMRSRSSLARRRASSARTWARWAERSIHPPASSVPTASNASHAASPAARVQLGHTSSFTSGAHPRHDVAEGEPGPRHHPVAPQGHVDEGDEQGQERGAAGVVEQPVRHRHREHDGVGGHRPPGAGQQGSGPRHQQGDAEHAQRPGLGLVLAATSVTRAAARPSPPPGRPAASGDRAITPAAAAAARGRRGGGHTAHRASGGAAVIVPAW